MSANVRFAEPRDADRIRTLYREAPQPFPMGEIEISFKSEPTHVVDTRWPGAKLAIAEEGERVVGAAWVAPHTLLVGGEPRPAAYLGGLCVHPDQRRKGIARALTEARIEHARSRTGESTVLYTYIVPSNAPSIGNAERWGKVTDRKVSAIQLPASVARARFPSRWSLRRATKDDAPEILAAFARHRSAYGAYWNASEELDAYLRRDDPTRSAWLLVDRAGRLLAGAQLLREDRLMANLTRPPKLGSTLAGLASMSIGRAMLCGLWESDRAEGAAAALWGAVAALLRNESVWLYAQGDPTGGPKLMSALALRFASTPLLVVASDARPFAGPRPVDLVLM